jgi:hypothetical protein
LAYADCKRLSNSIDRSIRICRCASVNPWGTQCKCLTTNPKDLVKCRQTSAIEMHMDFASSCTDANGVLLRAWRIALSITSGVGLNAAFPSQPFSETRAGRKWPESTQRDRSRGPAQVHHESRELKVPSCWDRDKSSIDPLCRTLSLHDKFHSLHKETNSPRSHNQIRRFCFREICSYRVGYKRILLDSKSGG